MSLPFAASVKGLPQVVFAATLALHLARLLVVWRSKRTRGAVDAVVGATLLLPPLAAAWGVHEARSRLLGLLTDSLAETASSHGAKVLSGSIEAQLNTLAMGGFAFLASAVLFALGLFLSTRKRERTAEHLSLVLVPATGFLLVATGFFHWLKGTIAIFEAAAAGGPDVVGLLLVTLADLRGHFRQSLLAGLAVTALATLVAVVIAWRRARSTDESREDPREEAAAKRQARRNLLAFAAAGILVAGAAALNLGMRSMRAENEQPWPWLFQGERSFIGDVPPPALDGPDEVLRAPIVTMDAGRLLLDGAVVSLDQLEERLTSLADAYARLQVREPFPAEINLVARADLASSVIDQALRKVRDAGYRSVKLLFVRSVTTVRPTLGSLSRTEVTAAKLSLDRPELEGAGEETGPVALLSLADFPQYDAWARAVVELRRAEKIVVLRLAPHAPSKRRQRRQIGLDEDGTRSH